jgi:glucose/mannose transport system substrate-binding protein
MRALALAIALAITAACTNTSSSSSTVEIYSWWVSNAENNALGAVLDDFTRKHPNISVVNAAAENALNAQDELQSRMRLGNPPDTFQVNGGVELRQYVPDVGPSQLDLLDGLAAQQNWQDHIPLEVWNSVNVGAHVYAVPVDVARVNALFYNKTVFDNLGLSPPVTMADFVSEAEILRTHHVRPIAIGDKAPWTLEVIFKSCLLTAGGARYYREFAAGLNPYFSGGTGSSDPTFDEAIRCFGTILSYANKDEMRMLTWDQAVSEVNAQSPAMTIMGDWALGEFLRLGAKPDVDFGEVAFPGSDSTFIFTTDTFVLPKFAKNRDGAMALLTEWGSPAGQSAFYPSKGSLPARDDVDMGAYNAISRATLIDLHNDTLVFDWAISLPQAFTTNFDRALDRFADDGNAENVVLAARNNYDLIEKGHLR